MSRYRNVRTAVNSLDEYKETLDSRGVKKIKQYRTQVLKNYDDSRIDYIERVWLDGDTFWKLAREAYGDQNLWYIIARFNNTPTEAHVKIGDIIKIPLDLSIALRVIV